MSNNQKTDLPRRSLWNRLVPVRIRHNIKLIFASFLALGLVGVLLGSFQIRPIVFSQTEMLPTITNNVAGTVDLFDLSVPHNISLEINDIAYDQMISDFQQFEEKTFVEADITIDGTFIPSVAVRLKGNSTLFGIRGRVPGAGSGPPPEAADNSDDKPPVPADGLPPGGPAAPPETPPAPPPSPLMIKVRALIAGATEDDPSTLPLLISFEEFMPGRGYQGRTELSLRPAAGGGASLNEALGLQLIEDSGQVSQRYSWLTFNVNGGPTRTRLILENPNQNYASALGMGRGVLYKSRNSNTFEYHGEDPILYAEDFLQLSAVGSRDLAPVIRLLGWIESASDEEFDAGLAERVDIPSFAQYVVTQDLLDNFDDMAGPGRNFLLWWDIEEEIFTVINWDMNLVLVGVGDVFKFPPPTPEPTEEEALASTDNTDAQETPTTEDGEAAPPAAGPPPGLRLGNSLKDRFVASETFAEVLATTREDMLQQWFKSGHALEVLTNLKAYVPITTHLSAEQIATQVAELTETIATTE